MNRWWSVTPTAQPTSDVAVRTYYTTQDVADINGSITTLANASAITEPQMRFYKINGGNASLSASTPHSGVQKATTYNATGYWDYTNAATASQSNWVMGTTAGGIKYGEYVVSSFSGGGGGGGAGGAGAFPVEWLNVSAEWQVASGEQKAHISWATASETNNAYFSVERSTDNLFFEQIGTQAGAGTTTEIHEYAFDDAAAASLVRNSKPLFYRIKQVDMDGNASYSETVELALEGVATQVAVYPNPAKDALHIRLTNAPAAATLKLYNVLGEEVLSQSLTASQSATDISALSQGVYMWRVVANGKTFAGKMVKE
jgi:hypothetical protein